jgi:predicted NBD/HSP70 family sugar kinase
MSSDCSTALSLMKISPGSSRITDVSMKRSTSATELILEAVACSDGLDRQALAEELDLPMGTVTSITAGLVRAGRLVERVPERRETGRRGRPPVQLAVPGPMRTMGVVVWSEARVHGLVCGYDGTRVQSGSFDVDPTDALAESPGVNAALALAAGGQLVPGQHDVAPPDRIVIGVPAPYQAGIGIPWPATPPLDDSADRPRFGRWLRSDPAASLSDRFGVPVRIENDANLGALGECRFGAGRDHRDLIYIKMGQRSIGAGLILDGRLFRGATGFAGELAHIHVDDGGALCVCGSRGCLSRRLSQTISDAVQPVYDHPVISATVRDLLAAEAPGSMRVLKDLGRTIGRPLADLCTFLNPSVVLLDASLGAAGASIADGIRDQIEAYAAPAAAAAVQVLTGAWADADVWGAVQLGRLQALRPLLHAGHG